MMISSILGIK